MSTTTKKKGVHARIAERFFLPDEIVANLRDHPYGKKDKDRRGVRGRFLTSMEDLERAYQTLSEKHFQMLLAHEMTDMKYEDIQEELGCKMGTVKSGLNRARRTLEEEFQVPAA